MVTLNPPKKRSRSNAAKHWCFTIKYSSCSRSAIISVLKPICIKYIFQREKGEDSGYEHWQGYLCLKVKKRFQAIGLPKETHFEKTRNVKCAIVYCAKHDTAVMPLEREVYGLKVPRALDLISYEELRQWQKDIADNFDKPATKFDRKIHWFWEPTGGVGKSVLCKYFVDQKNAICMSGKGNDALYGIQQYVLKNGCGPEIVIMDIPRCVGFISHNALEKVKNGCFFSGKYEGGMVRFNTPHLLVFSNERPDFEKMSEDRWVVKRLEVEK